jgi:hypothetical protein
MRGAAFIRVLAMLCTLACSSLVQAQTMLPTDKGLPVRVKVAVSYIEITAFNENTGSFNATVDLRLRWEDPRLKRPSEEQTDPPKVYRGPDAQAQIAKIWVPEAEPVNRRGNATFSAAGLRLFPDGQVEMIRRVTAEFTTPFEVERFPFDRQQLRFEIAVRNQTSDAVALEFEQQDLDVSRAAAAASLDGWVIGFVSLSAKPLAGWYGASHARVIASLEITRQSSGVAAAIFVPLFASLLIPLLGIWLNKTEDGVFQIDTFEFVNLIVGGLFAVIALNFTVNSMYQVLTGGDNPVNRLFTLNYATLGISLLVNILLFQFSVVERMFGRYVQEQLYFFLSWAVPVLVFTMAGAILLVAIA